ncbi:MAG: sulfatase-like hydrolase/transferase [Chloroflexota bacterium]
MTQPNILLIMSDNHPAELLGCYGNPEVQTPHLDRLAQEGTRFDRTFAVNAMCSPCRASVLTGMMPSEHGIHTWIDDRKMERWPTAWNALNDIQTLPERLQANQYQTALIGKYHLGSPFEPQNGFDHWFTFPHGHTRSFWNNTFIDNGRSYTDPRHSVDVFTEKAVHYLEGYAEDAPFFMLLTYNGPYGHWPAIKGKPQNRFAELYQDCPMDSFPREGLNKAVIDRFLLRQNESGGGLDYSAPLQILNDRATMRNYASQMSMVDDGVGRVMAALDAQGLKENTIVIYTTDHGFSIGHHGYWGHAQVTLPATGHASAYHIPLIMRGPHIMSHSHCDNLVSQIDLFPTILEMTNAPTVTGLPARPLTPLLQAELAEWEDVIFLEQEETRAIRTDKWLYVKRFKENENYPFQDELYDLIDDPGERHNVLTAHPDIAQTLDNQLMTFFSKHSAERYDLWRGGTTKSNSDKPWLWQGAWGQAWQPVF